MFPERLDHYLTKHGISNYKIEKATKISNSLVGYWRKGSKTPTLCNLIKLCDYLDVPIDYLTGRMNEDEYKVLLHYRDTLEKKSKK
ncbi:MAG: helix-turn-helix transcriptional regulator [Anaerostipes sp.]|jgi:transcriptional regulator with XRE-family HTH domain|nr:helix-turn-helix transcriptional regulator [Anaerostipes sp.]MDD3745524.1 helix-turn-helix transcriptional regulator [Anaerostipes sp.]